MDFLQNYIMIKFGVSISLVFYNASYFSSIKLTAFANEKWIKLYYSTNYYPQGNGLEESTNKNMIRILKKTMIENQRSWHLSLPNALWADRVTPNNSLGVSTYTLVYGKEVVLPPNILLPSSIIAQESRATDNEILQIWIYNLLKSKESRSKAKESFKHQQEIVKRWFDKHKARNKDSEVGDLVLKWDHPHDENGKHTKFQQSWVGPFQIAVKLGSSTYKLQDLQGWEENLPINGLVLKPYFSWSFWFCFCT